MTYLNLIITESGRWLADSGISYYNIYVLFIVHSQCCECISWMKCSNLQWLIKVGFVINISEGEELTFLSKSRKEKNDCFTEASNPNSILFLIVLSEINWKSLGLVWELRISTFSFYSLSGGISAAIQTEQLHSSSRALNKHHLNIKSKNIHLPFVLTILLSNLFYSGGIKQFHT